jgi:UDP-N-acetylglucosamine 4-epimerase
MHEQVYHTQHLAELRFLITGGAGFIGSNLVDYLLRHGAAQVRALDNFSNGYRENILPYFNHPNFELYEGDIRNLDECKKALHGIHYVSHQAALGSVPRSINDPITSNDVNISGFLNMLVASKESPTLKRFVYAASSSSYGDSPLLPKVEGEEGKPLSPYAVTKWVNELYADVFSKVYGFHTIGLRYFNIFGPKQNPLNPYAAVIPIFINAAIQGKPPIINGDGKTSRDFTYVENAIQANIKAMLNTPKLGRHEVMNIAAGDRTTLNKLWKLIAAEAGCSELQPEYRVERPGDVKASLADLSKAKRIIEYEPLVGVKKGLNLAFQWYKANLQV